MTKSAKTASQKAVVKSDAGKYSEAPLELITIVPKPQSPDDKRLFFNPRNEENFTPEKMRSLIHTIRIDGLLEPLIGRPIYNANQNLEYVELIAGERRTRSIREIVKNDLPCFSEDEPKPKKFVSGSIVTCVSRFGTVMKHTGDIVTIEFHESHDRPAETLDCNYEDVSPTVSAKILYKTVPIKLITNCNDRRAMRLNWIENAEGEPLSTKDEILHIERLVSLDYDQKQIADMLSTNVTFVSQTASFREQLPPEAFEYLIQGRMARHVAVRMLSYPKNVRQQYFDAMKDIEKKETNEALRKHKAEKEALEDEAIIIEDDAKKAESEGDHTQATKLRRRLKTVEMKISQQNEKGKRVKEEQGVIKQGHAQRAAARQGILPRNAKMLPKDHIQEHYCRDMVKYSSEQLVDPKTKNLIPCEMASIVRRTAMAIIQGEYDPLEVIRRYMIENGKWADTEEPSEDLSEDSKISLPNLKNARKSLDEEDEIDEDEIDEDEIDEDYEDEDDFDDVDGFQDSDDFDFDDGFDPIAVLGKRYNPD